MSARSRLRYVVATLTGFCLIVLCVPETISTQVAAQTILNLDFEESWGGQPQLPRVWGMIQANGAVSLDEKIVYSGNRSLRIARNDSAGHSAIYLRLPIHLIIGKRVQFSGYIQTNNVASRFAGLWFRVDDESSEQIAFDDMPERAPRGTSVWARYSVELEVPPEAGFAVLGCYLEGNGTAWFDALEIEVEGKPLHELLRNEYDEPTIDQINWVRENAIHFITPDAGNDFSDLEPLKGLIGDARIVALGEGTHGTSEFFRMKHRLVEFLAVEMGFSVFAIEANMPECEALNQYIQTGEGDPRKGLDAIYFWTWNTHEVLEMIEWMREYNASGVGNIEFWGFDMQKPAVAIRNVLSFLEEVDPEYQIIAEERYTTVTELSREWRRSGQVAPTDETAPILVKLTQEVLNHLEEAREIYIRRFSAEEVNWAIQKARVVRQSVEPLSRDRSMSDNVDWILDHHPPGTRIVLWAHNGHVHERLPAMGGHLAVRYGEGYYSMGFCFEEGEYTAVGPNGLTSYSAGPPVPGSAEFVFQQTGLPYFILDLDAAERGSTASGWLYSSRPFRSIGARAIDNPFYPVVLGQEYDALIWIAQTTNSRLLHPRDR